MSELTNQIKSLMSDEALRQALTKESLQEMLTELDSNEIVIKDQEATIEALNATEKKIRIELGQIRDARDLNIKLVNELTAKLTDIEAREKACITTEIRNEFASQRGDEMKGLLSDVFRNTVVRQTILGDKLTSVPGSRDCVGYVQRDQNVEEKTERTEE